MSRRTRRHIFVILMILLIASTRFLFESDPLYDFVQKITLPITKLISPASVYQQDQVASSYDLVDQAASQQMAVLREELGLDDEKYSTVAGDVVKRDVAGFRKSIWINRGEDDEVKVDDTVLSSGVLIGKVSVVASNFCEVQLISDPQFRASASVDGQMGIVKVIGGSVAYDLVPSSGLEGGVAVTDGIDGFFPVGIVIGELDSDISEQNEVFRRYSLRLGQNPASISSVKIIVNSNYNL